MTLGYITREDTRAVIYIRVSTVGQESNYSLSTQLEACRKYAAANGLTVVEECQDVMSGVTLDRPGLARVRELVRRKQVDAVIVYTSDRLSRKPAHGYLIRDELRAIGCQLHYVTSGQVKDTPEDDLFNNLRDAVAEYEREKIKERMMRGKRGKIESGRILGHGLCTPYGYRHAGKGRTKELVIVPQEAEIVVLIFRWCVLDNMTINAITDRLIEMRVPTPFDNGRKVSKKQRGFAQWSKSTVARILRNATYTGTLYHNHYERIDKHTVVTRPREEWIGVAVPAMISQEMFDAAQAKLTQRRAMSTRNSKTFYLLGKRIRCKCEHALAGEVSKGTKTYRCTSRGKYAIERCTMGNIKASIIEPVIWAWLVEQLQPEILLQGLKREQETTAARRAEITRELETLQRQRADLDTQVKRLRDAYAAGAIELADLSADKAIREAAMKALDAEITALREQLASAGLTQQETRELLAVAAELSDEAQHVTTDEERRWLIDKLNVKVTVVRNADGRRFAKVVGRLSIEPDVLPIDGIVSTTCLHCRHNTNRVIALSGILPLAA